MIVLATRNKKKIEEIRKIFTMMKTVPQLLTVNNFSECREVEEDGETFEANAVKKAQYVAECSGMLAIADDSGLEVDVLEGSPGVFSARYAGESADDRANLEKLLNEMKQVPDDKRNARFVCCIAMAFPRGDVKIFEGYVKGRIGIKPKGENGFGYDPVFYPEGYDKTFAEMSDTEKNVISHRGRALRYLQKYLMEKGY